METNTKKKKLTTTGLAIALAALLLIGGGTFAYLQSSTGDVVNAFNTNQVKVDLTETTGESYNIIPGTSETKDPKVTVDNTVEAYVFVEVTDTTEKLVTYDIAEGWKLLDGYDNVYYREVEANATEKEFAVLKDNKVTYSADLKNSDMLEEGGVLKKGIELTFKAYAIQKEGFENALVQAWLNLNGEAVTVDSTEAFTDAIKTATSDQVITLEDDITLSTAIPQSDNEITYIDLGGNTLTTTANSSTAVEGGKTLVLENGTVKYEGTAANVSSINVTTGSSVTLRNVVMEAKGATIYPKGDAAEVNVIDSTVKSENSYCVATNAATVDNYNVEINLTDSTFEGPTAVLINVPGNLNMNKCTVNANMHGVVVRGGTAVIENCKIANTSNDDWAVRYFDETDWGTGNMLPLAGITIGNKKTNSYQYPSNVTLTNTTVTSVLYPVIYTYGNTTEENGVTLTYDGKIKDNDVIYGGGYVTINGTVQR
ncbi:hypothetical protein LI177_05965 [bacterium 210820-DFI.6.37]|nr:hypothetical protein [bacterium 210820-DFI.6.37]